MAKALEGALELHADYPNNAKALAGKKGKPLEFASPEQYPSLKEKFTDALNYEGNVVASCIHCHQIGDARREYYWQQGKPIPDEFLHPYPHPKSIGLILDPETKSTVQTVTAESVATASGVLAGDEIVSMQEQPILSIADVQWVLHNLPDEACSVAMVVRREGSEMPLRLQLPDSWKELDNTSWRVSSWQMSRIALGGMRLDVATEEERKAANVADGMALKVRSAGRYGAHAAARKAGFKEGDILVAFDGQNEFQRESDIFNYVAKNSRAGRTVQVDVARGAQRLSFRLPIQQ